MTAAVLRGFCYRCSAEGTGSHHASLRGELDTSFTSKAREAQALPVEGDLASIELTKA